MLKEVMTPEVEVIRPNASLTEAAMTAMRMKDLDVGLIPVCDGDRLCGMLTDRDIAVRSDGVKLGIVGTPRRHRQCYLPRHSKTGARSSDHLGQTVVTDPKVAPDSNLFEIWRKRKNRIRRKFRGNGLPFRDNPSLPRRALRGAKIPH